MSEPPPHMDVRNLKSGGLEYRTGTFLVDRGGVDVPFMSKVVWEISGGPERPPRKDPKVGGEEVYSLGSPRLS